MLPDDEEPDYTVSKTLLLVICAAVLVYAVSRGLFG